MPALANYASEGTLTLNGVSFTNPAWTVCADENGEGGLLQLWGLMSDRRGEDRVLPTATGVVAYPKRRTVTPYSLRLIVIGDVNSSGVANADDRVGLQTNLAAIKAVIDTASTGTAGTVTATLTRFTGASLTGAVHVLKLEQQRYGLSESGKEGSWYEGTLQLSIPAGILV